MTDLPRKAVVRSAKLATVPLGFAGRTALGLGKRIGGRPAEVVAAELQARTAEQLFRTLGELKGGAMKVGQMLSVLESAFPEEMAGPYREQLTRLQDAAPPMPTQTVREILAHLVAVERLATEWVTAPAGSELAPSDHLQATRWAREAFAEMPVDELRSTWASAARALAVACSAAPADRAVLVHDLPTDVDLNRDYSAAHSDLSKYVRAVGDDPTGRPGN